MITRKRALTVIVPLAAVAVVACWWWVRGPGEKPPLTAASPGAPAEPVQKKPVLSPQVQALLDTGKVSSARRNEILAGLGDRLSDEDRAALLDCIGNTPPNGMTTAEWYSLANDILQTLRRQQPYTRQYTDHLIGFWRDRKLDPTLRDYSIQQLREWVADSDSRTLHEERPEKIAEIRQVFVDAATPGHPTCDPQSTTTGTVLLGLAEWAAAKQVDGALLQRMLLAHASNGSAHRGVRATALQICARLGIGEALPVARSVLKDSPDTILRMSAIACIGILGTPEDLQLLSKFQQGNGSDPMLQASLHKALKNLTSKHPPQ